MVVRAAPANLLTVGQSSAKSIHGSIEFSDENTDSYQAKTTRLRRDGSSEDGNRRTWTFSAWIKKRTTVPAGSARQVIFSNGANSNGEGFLAFTSDDALEIGNDGHNNFVTTARRFRDMGWYHIVWAADTEQSSANDRWKIYVNGELIPASDYGSPSITQYGEGYIQAYGEHGMWQCLGDRERGHQNSGNAAWPFDGNMCEVWFIDGEQLPAERFGFEDPLTGTWRPKQFFPTATPNDGGTWSSTSDSPIDANFFDGCSREGGTGKVLVSGSDTSWKTITDKSFTIHKSLELITSDGFHIRARLNGASGDIVATGDHTNSSTFGHVPNTGTFPFDISALTLPYTVNGIEYISGNGSGSTYIHGLKVDGVTLIDGNRSNVGKDGFYLPLDGTKAIGQDLSGNGNDFTPIMEGGNAAHTDIKSATGGLPILNTSDDGRTALTGVRGSNINVGYAVTVYNDGGGNKYYLDGTKQKTLSGLSRGATYTFDVSDTSNIGHPLRIATVDKHTNTKWYSCYFDGTGDYLDVDAGGTELNFGTGDFTIEGWFYFDSSATPNNGLWQISGTTNGLTPSANTLSVNLETSGGRTYQLYGASAGGWRTGGKNYEFMPFKWYHVAEVRSSGTITIYINGRPSQSWADTSTYDYDAVAVGGYYTTSYLWNGYVSNFRIVKGTALYTSAFTPSAVPLTNITATELLCCQESTVTNAEVKPAAITSNGSTSSSTKSPFIYDPTQGVTSNGFPIGTYAVDFDGNDYISVPASTDIASFNDEFTCECFFNLRSFNNDNALIMGSWNHPSARRVWQIRVTNEGRIDWYVSYDGSTSSANNLATDVSMIKTGRWYHIAAERFGNVLTLYLDGIAIASHAMTSATYNNTQDGVMIGGASWSAQKYIDGMISNVRIVKGGAVYKRNFIPKGPLTNITNTKLLCCNGDDPTDHTVIPTGTITTSGDPSTINLTTIKSKGGYTKITIPHNAPDSLYYYCDVHAGMGSSITSITTGLPSVVDQYASNCILALPLMGNQYPSRSDDVSDQINCTTRKKTLTIYGNVADTQTNSNFYGTSYSFDGNGDYLELVDQDNFELQQDFTVEWWERRNDNTGTDSFWAIGDSKNANGFQAYYGSSGTKMKYYNNNNAFIEHLGVQHANGTWHHHAAVRHNGTVNMYVDGIKVASDTRTNPIGTGSDGYLNVGRGYYNGGPDNYIDGQMQDFRIYNAAKYVENFIPPSTHFTGAKITPSGVSFASKNKDRYSSDLVSGSVWFDGSKNEMRCADTGDLDLFATWTIEAWVWKLDDAGADGTARAIISKWDNTGGNNDKGWYLRIQNSTTNRLSFLWTTDGSTNIELISNATITNKRWHHVAVVSNGAYLTMYIDGVQDITTHKGTYTTVKDATIPILIGGVHIPTNTQQWKGYLSNVRLVRGTIYTMDVTNNGSSDYVFSSATDRNGSVSGNDPTININVGDTLKITNNAASAHPLWLKTVQETGTDNGIAGVTNNGSSSNGVVITWVPDTVGTYFYNCQHHAGMTGTIIVSDGANTSGAVYTEEFIPPRKPLTNISGTKLLACQSLRETTEAVSPKTLQYTGKKVANTGATVDSDDPFSSGELGCVSFDGTNDYIKVNDSGSLDDFDFGTGDFTIELWIKMSSNSGTNPVLIGAVGGWYIQLKTGDTIISFYTGSTEYTHTGSALSTGSWHHIAASREGTALKVYVDGTKRIDETNSQSVNLAADLCIGSFGGSNLYFGGKISHVRVIKGKALYTGSSITVPTSPIEPTPETVLLCCSDNYRVTTSYDSTTTNLRTFNPFDGTQERLDSDYCTWNNIDKLSSNITLKNGNLDWSCTNADGGNARGTVVMTSGKYYWEITTRVGNRFHCGVSRIDMALPSGDAGNTATEWVYRTDGYKVHNSSEAQVGDDIKAAGNIVMIAYNADDGEIYFGGNGQWFDFADPSRRINPAYTNATPGTHGVAPSIGRRTSNCGGDANFGQKPFHYQPPEGYSVLTVSNSAKPDILAPEQYFKPVIWTGNNAAGRKIRGLLFRPDFVWFKKRSSGGQNHTLFDSVRGNGRRLMLPAVSGQATPIDELTRFNEDGFTIDTDNFQNENAKDYVAWCWKAGGRNETTDWGSVKFDGSGDALTIADHADLEMASETNWTIEFWVKLNATPSGDWKVIVGKGLSSGNNYEWFFECFTDNTLKFLASDDGTAWPINQSFTDALTVGTWYHVAVVRNGTGANTLKGYLNGVQKWSITSLNLHTSGGGLGIGAHNDGGSLALESNTTVSNLRIVKGTSVYTSGFTPSTTPLTAISNTKLLCCADVNTLEYAVSPGAISRSGGAIGEWTESPFTKKRFQIDGLGYATAAAAGLDGGNLTPTDANIGTKNGFSIIGYTGNGTGNQTIKHGLTKPPELMIIKRTDGDGYWDVTYTHGDGSYDFMQLEVANAKADITGRTAPDSSVMYVSGAGSNDANGEKYVAYSWHSVPGYSKFSSYVGNWSPTGPFVYCGFKPAFLLIKDATGANSWAMYDTARDIGNPADSLLQAQDTSGDATYGAIDFLYNGFKIKAQVNALNASGNVYMFAAFAERPEINLYGAPSSSR